MRRLGYGWLAVLCLTELPILASAQSQTDLPKDFVPTFQAVNTAYAHQDIEGILAYYAPRCAILSESYLHDFHLKSASADKPKDNLARHDLAWRRQHLHRFFIASDFDFPSLSNFGPVRNVRLTFSVQQSLLNRKGTELRLTVERKAILDRGQAQEAHSEVDEEVWSRNGQGWQLKSLTIHPKVGWIDYS